MALQGGLWKCLGNTKQKNCVVSEEILPQRDLITTASWDCQQASKDQLSTVFVKLGVVDWISLAMPVFEYTVCFLYRGYIYIYIKIYAHI